MSNNASGRPPLTPAERMIRRTLALMQNKGLGWSKAMMLAEDSVRDEETKNRDRRPD